MSLIDNKSQIFSSMTKTSKKNPWQKLQSREKIDRKMRNGTIVFVAVCVCKTSVLFNVVCLSLFYVLNVHKGTVVCKALLFKIK